MEHRVTSYQSQGLDRALQLLHLLGEADGPLGLAELTKRLDLPKPTISRLLHVLVAQDFVFREGDPPVYSVGHAIFEIAEGYQRQVGLSDIATPYLRRLAAETMLTANLGTLEGPWVLHACVEEPDRPLRFRSAKGSLDYAYCTGLGKMLLSTLPSEERGAHLPGEPYDAFTPKTLVTREALDEELARIAARGYAIDDEERDRGVVCVAVDIPVDSERPIALSVAGPAGELTDESRSRIVPLLHRVADELARDRRFASALKIARPIVNVPGLLNHGSD